MAPKPTARYDKLALRHEKGTFVATPQIDKEYPYLFDTLILDQFYSRVFILLALIICIAVYFLDKSQKKHTILRNYPLVGHFHYWCEYLGEFFRQYFFTSGREELRFNRAERNWVYGAAKHIDTTIGFGSTRPLHSTGTLYFVSASFFP